MPQSSIPFQPSDSFAVDLRGEPIAEASAASTVAPLLTSPPDAKELPPVRLSVDFIAGKKIVVLHLAPGAIEERKRALVIRDLLEGLE